jgi:hypothetical protein
MKMDSLLRTSGACVVLKEDAYSFLSYIFSIFLTKSLQAVATCNNVIPFKWNFSQMKDKAWIWHCAPFGSYANYKKMTEKSGKKNKELPFFNLRINIRKKQIWP